MFGINGGELVVLLVLAFLLIGPERLPELAQQLGRLTREVKKIATGAKEKVREELGPEFDDLAALDPRQYDPRRIVREALMEDDEPARPARPRAARRPSPATKARTDATAAGAAGADAGVAGAAATAAGVSVNSDGEPATAGRAPAAPSSAAPSGAAPSSSAAPSAAAPSSSAAHSAAASSAARVAAVTPPAQVLAQARGAAPTATALAEQPVEPGADEEPYVVPFDDEAT